MLPVREKVIHTTVRIRFSKVGDLQYISHLDLHRTFCRLFVRAGVPVWYSEGYSPHPHLVFATPLSVGAESLCEYLDVSIVGTPEEIDIPDIRARLADTGIVGLIVEDVYLPNTKFSSITDSDYRIEIVTSDADARLARACEDVLCEAPLCTVKRTKSGEREVDISAQIRKVSVDFADGRIKIAARLCADSSSFLNPEYLVKILRERCGVLCGDPMCESYSILRTAVYAGDKEFQ